MTQRHDDPPSPSAEEARGTPIADDISHQTALTSGRERNRTFLSWRPLGAAGMPSLGGSWLGGGKGAEKHRPLRNFDFFLLALPSPGIL